MKGSVSLHSSRVSPDTFEQEYDLAIFVSSYESRCTRSSIYGGLRFKHALTILFSEMEKERAKFGHDDVILRKASSASTCHVSLEPSVTDYSQTTKEVLSVIARTLDPTRANRVFIDITTCPKYYFAALLAQLFLSGFATDYSFFYAEGRYSSPKKDGNIPFTESEWILHTVPGLEGGFDPTLGRGFVLSVGFESPKVRRLVSRYLPDSILLLEADPGFNSDYTDRARDAAQTVLDFSGTAATRYLQGPRIAAHAGDATAALSALESAQRDGIWDVDGSNWTLVPCGPKPHALSMVLFALKNRNCCFAYPSPQRYGIYKSEATGQDWMYCVSDNSLSLAR